MAVFSIAIWVAFAVFINTWLPYLDAKDQAAYIREHPERHLVYIKYRDEAAPISHEVAMITTTGKFAFLYDSESKMTFAVPFTSITTIGFVSEKDIVTTAPR